jgi:hypothetical protein
LSTGKLSVVQRWQDAVNARDLQGLVDLSHEDIEIVGPRGTARGHAVLAEWLDRAGLSWRPLRWFCGDKGSVVVEQEAEWTDPRTGEARGGAVLASHFTVGDGRVLRFARHDTVGDALAAAGLPVQSEVHCGL